MSLADLARSIESKRPVPSVRLSKAIESALGPKHASDDRLQSCDDCGHLAELWHHDATDQALCSACTTKAYAVAEQETAEIEAAAPAPKLYTDIVTIDGTNVLTSADHLAKRCEAMAATIAQLETTIVELRSQLEHRKAASVATIGLRFNGPQGTGTADRIKAVGGTWAWSQKALRRGYWIIPSTTPAAQLVNDLVAEGRPCETFAL